MMYAQWFICQCKCKKLTKKQAPEKEAEAARREKRHGTQKGNVERGNVTSISYQTQEKRKQIVRAKIFTNKQLNHLCEIEL